MEVNFLKQNSCIPSWPGVFQLGTFLRVRLSESRWIFALGPISRPSNSFFIQFIHSVFLLYSLRSHILLKICIVSLSSDCWCIFLHPPPTCRRNIFRCFGMSCFVCIVLSCLDIFLVFCQYLLIYFLKRYCLFYLLHCFLFSPQNTPPFSSVLSFFSCCHRFLISVSRRISHTGFEFRFMFFNWTMNLSQTHE